MKKTTVLITTLACLIWLIGTINATAADPPEEPILRIETGMHTAAINRIGMDAAERILMTTSKDKTVRVWDMASGRLKKILRAPMDTGKDGMLYTAALAPNGKTIAAGGWTGYALKGGHSIYIFDLSSGVIRHRIIGLPRAILHLAFSKDGRFMVVCLAAKNGVRIYDTRKWKLVMKDSNYGDNSWWADFDRSGRLVTVSLDGYIRLYDNNFRRVAKLKAPGGKKPFSAVFSPDGSKIAVGFYYTTRVNVLSGSDLSFLFAPNSSGVDNGNLHGVAWSADGHQLYAGGRYSKGPNMRSIRRWSKAGRGPYTDLPASPNTIVHILPLENGDIVFGSAEPAWGIFNRQGDKTFFKGASVPDYRWVFKGGFLVSESGGTVRFGFDVRGKRPAVFSVSSRTLSPSPSDAYQKSLKSPVTQRDGLSVTGWKDTRTPKLNGKALKLEKYERSRSLAIAPNRKRFLLGAEWFIRLFNHAGVLQWEVPVQGAAWGVNISGNGKVAVAALGDGTIRWYRMSDGKKLMTLFPHKDGRRWVLWTPSGYYAASAGADDLIGWHINRGRDNTPDFFPASKFRSAFYRPDVTEKILATLDEGEALAQADEEAGRRQQEIDLTQMLPPVVTILSPEDDAAVSESEIRVRYKVRSPSGEKVTKVYALIDGRLVTKRGIKRNKNEIRVNIPERDCEVSVIAENRYAASEPASIRLNWRGKQPAEFVIKPKLYLLAVGVSKYDKPGLRLDYPAKDARDMAAVMKKQSKGIYRDVSAKVITDADAAKGGVMDGLDWIERETTGKDVAMLFLAGHGVNDRNGNYYYLPANADPERLRRTGVPYSVIRDIVSNLPGKVLFFLDTCHSGNIMGSKRRGAQADIDKIASDLAAAENGVVVFASSTGRQYSVESHNWQNGAFTKALVEGISGKADYTKDRKITINELDLYLSERVKELTNGSQTPVTTKPKTIPDYPIAVR
ncbi:caspase family protein [Desulfococcaceae bacterium HSG9]|nr:caspase family protein [Desulfococcaceae bacterium HSG9]